MWANGALYPSFGNPTMQQMSVNLPCNPAWQANCHWQVLLLLEFNHLLVRGDIEAVSELGWGHGIEFQHLGFRMYIRPGAQAFLKTLLEMTLTRCAFAIFTGLSHDIVVPMMIKLFQIVTQDASWQEGQEDLGQSLFVVNHSGIRIYIINRSVKEQLGSSPDKCMSLEQSRRYLYYDFGKAWQVLNCSYFNFHKQNTMLIGFKEDRLACPENVLSMNRWAQWESNEYMDHMCNYIWHLFNTNPGNASDVCSLLQTIKHTASI